MDPLLTTNGGTEDLDHLSVKTLEYFGYKETAYRQQDNLTVKKMYLIS